MRTAEFDYELPSELIAQQPLPKRSASRMLVLDRNAGSWTDGWFRDLPAHVGPGDCLVVNDSRVIAARLKGRRPVTGGSAEILVLGPHGGSGSRWRALVRPGRRLRDGATIEVGGGVAVVRERLGDGVRVVEFPGLGLAAVEKLLAEHGRVPLPPYIRRPDDEHDRERYQTVYARHSGSVAAPTAGLHFDRDLLSAVRECGAEFASITLHVGLGTFRPVSAVHVEGHRMHAETFRVPAEAAASIASARRILAVGTTCVRALETAARTGGWPGGATAGETDLFVVPGFRFRAVEGLLTNFHLPRSSLLMLVSAFAGKELVLNAYAHAVRERYRFYSYGDCMLIL